MKVLRKIIEIDEELCDGCGQCIMSCAESALQLVDGKARVVSDIFCDGLGACLGECPTGALSIIEREADEFDEEAVESHMAETEKMESTQTLPCGCPSASIQTFTPSASGHGAGSVHRDESTEESALWHWPIQIKLVPAKAPFLKGADLIVLADCCAVAIPNLHRDFIKGKVVMMGCPKLDQAGEYIDKFSEIFKTAGIRSITTVMMEVPCCSGLEMIVKKGLEKAGVTIPMKRVVISTRGKVVENV
ncbi:MAG: 4Fe-4S dicluster domain-containing protein [Syntrophales bacterium]